MTNLVIIPKCESDRIKCKSFVRVYKRTNPESKVIVTLSEIEVSYTEQFGFLFEMECRVLERDYSDYRVILKVPEKPPTTFNTVLLDLSEYANKEYDFWYPVNAPYYIYNNLAFVLRFEAPPDFKSVCIG